MNLAHASKIMTQSPTTHTFREATEDDAGAISALIGSTWAKFFAYSVSESDLETYLNETVSKSQIAREIADEQKRFLVAVEKSSPSQIIGVAQLNLNTSDDCLTLSSPIELNRLYIRPDQQGSGLAPALLDYAERISRGLGREGMWLGVWEDNARGIRFYEKMGFKRRGEHSFWVGESKRRDWIMEKAI